MTEHRVQAGDLTLTMLIEPASVHVGVMTESKFFIRHNPYGPAFFSKAWSGAFSRKEGELLIEWLETAVQAAEITTPAFMGPFVRGVGLAQFFLFDQQVWSDGYYKVCPDSDTMSLLLRVLSDRYSLVKFCASDAGEIILKRAQDMLGLDDKSVQSLLAGIELT